MTNELSALEREIEETRQRLAHTIDQLTYRANPKTIVGREVAEHVTPESYADGRLVVRTDSTAWATQMKLLAAEVVRRLNEVLGDETVRVIDVVGPQGPSWSRGRLRVKGRGPRDTYG